MECELSGSSLKFDISAWSTLKYGDWQISQEWDYNQEVSFEDFNNKKPLFL